ncbi:MAG: oligosaccharide flippase family protein [Prevotella sp.]|jgi:O-antigen/teichoic acid export membrane protein|nr:oligosaccharide flippase family protein [Prevotella sp.]MBQ6549581.1 oligosaccharide flippase family protein [Prevotella sp.]
MLKVIKEKLNSGMGKDIVWTFSLQILIMLCSFAINKLLANRLSIDDFGQYNVIKRSVQVLSFVMLAGVGIALPRYIPLYRNSTPPRRIAPLLSASFIYIIGVSFLVVLVCLLFSTQMQDIIIGQRNNQTLLIIALGYAFILALAQYVFAYYRGIGHFKWYNGTQLAMQLLIIVPLVLLPILTVSHVFSSWLIITILLVAYLMGRELWGKHFHFYVQFESLREIIKYASGRLVADFFQFSLAAFPLIYISNMQGLQTTAYFSVGIFFVTMITPLFSFMGIILLPYVSQAIAKDEMKSANRLIQRLLLIYIGGALFFIAVLYLFTDFLTILLFNSDYVVTSDLTRIMVLSILPQAVYILYRNTIDAASIIPYNAIILGISLITMVVSFTLSSSITHYAWAYLAVSTLQGLLACLVWRFLRMK